MTTTTKKLCKITTITLLLIMVSSPLFADTMRYVGEQMGYSRLKTPHIRVRILHDTTHVRIGAKGNCIFHVWNEQDEESVYYSSDPLNIRGDGKHLELTDTEHNLIETKLTRVIAVAEVKSWLYLNRKKFRGILEVYPEAGGELYVVNVLHIEDYLRGVLPPEIGVRKPNEFEAVKAQAVAARTYALASRDKYPDKQYDLVNDVLDQVYKGWEGERRDTDMAVHDTRGEVLTYAGELIDAYYHSTCAGYTDQIEYVWPKPPQPYLKGVVDDTFCLWSKYYSWEDRFDAKKLLENTRGYLKRTGHSTNKLGNILKDLTIESRSGGGRIQRLDVVTESGTITLERDEIRWAFGRPAGAGILRSSNFRLELENDSFGNVDSVFIEGHGYGHGVGMCQCGAIGRARAGQSYREILTHYYTGAEITRLY